MILSAIRPTIFDIGLTDNRNVVVQFLNLVTFFELNHYTLRFAYLMLSKYIFRSAGVLLNDIAWCRVRFICNTTKLSNWSRVARKVTCKQTLTSLKEMFPVLDIFHANTLRDAIDLQEYFYRRHSILQPTMSLFQYTCYTIHLGHFISPLFAPTVILCYAFLSTDFPHRSQYHMMVKTFLTMRYSVTLISTCC